MMDMDETRSESVRVRIRPSELEIVQRAAARRGWTVSEYMRASALTCSAVDGHPTALKLVARNFVEQVREWFAVAKGRVA